MTIDEDGDGYFDRELKFNMTPDELKGLALKKVARQILIFQALLLMMLCMYVYFLYTRSIS